jgi:phenylalanyl-tRNA synthetase alpha chain
MKEQLQELRTASAAAIAAAIDPETLDSLRVRYLGKKGELTRILKQMAL